MVTSKCVRCGCEFDTKHATSMCPVCTELDATIPKIVEVLAVPEALLEDTSMELPAKKTRGKK